MEESSGRPSRKRSAEKTVEDQLFANSGLTDQDRRKIRQSQRQLHAEILQGESKTAEKEEHDDEDEQEAAESGDHIRVLDQQRSLNNDLFRNVRYTREAVLDAENVNLLATKYAQQHERLFQVPRFDANKLAIKLVAKCTNRQGSSSFFDWKTLGRETGVCFNAIPSQCIFLAGTLDSEKVAVERKARAPREKLAKEDAQEVRPEQVTKETNNQDADKLSATEKTIKVMRKKLKERCAEAKAKKEDDVDGLQYLFNPKSFTQTVENMFHFSFFIKKGEAAISVDPSKANENSSALRVKFTSSPKEPVPSRQAVCAFTIRDWRKLCESYNLQQGDIPHRTGSKHARKEIAVSQT